MASFTSLPFEITSRIVESCLYDTAEDLARQDRTPGKDNLYWRFQPRHAFSLLAFTCKDLIYEVLRLAKRLAKVRKDRVSEMAQSNPCQPDRRLNKRSGTHGTTIGRCALCHTRKLVARQNVHICGAWHFLRCVKKRTESKDYECECEKAEGAAIVTANPDGHGFKPEWFVWRGITIATDSDHLGHCFCGCGKHALMSNTHKDQRVPRRRRW